MRGRVRGQATLDLDTEQIGDIERALAASGHGWVIGVDEAGRGPLAGPVVVAAVALPLGPPEWCAGLDDSKRLRPGERARWSAELRARGVAHSVVRVEAEEVDRRNVLRASLEGMRAAVAGLMADTPALRAAPVLIDGNQRVGAPGLDERPIVRGDARCYSIAAASVLAKTERDGIMLALGAEYPGYGFEQHFGYPTPAHLRALTALGPSPVHRRTFGPVRAALLRAAGDHATGRSCVRPHP